VNPANEREKLEGALHKVAKKRKLSAGWVSKVMAGITA